MRNNSLSLGEFLSAVFASTASDADGWEAIDRLLERFGVDGARPRADFSRPCRAVHGFGRVSRLAVADRFIMMKPARSKCSTRRFATISAMISSASWVRLRP
jgi:hypothetical protein